MSPRIELHRTQDTPEPPGFPGRFIVKRVDAGEYSRFGCVFRADILLRLSSRGAIGAVGRFGTVA